MTIHMIWGNTSGNSSHSLALAALATIALWLSLFCGGVDGFLVKSKTDSTWGTSWSRDFETSRVFSVGTIFKDGKNDVSMSGAADTDCLVLMASGKGTWLVTEFENIQVCAGGTVFLDDDDYPYVATLGFTGNQPLLQLLGNLRDVDDNAKAIPGPQWKLPLNNIGVAIDAAEEMRVIVGLHDANGMVITGNATTSVGFGATLAGLSEHWKIMTHPKWLAEPQTLPQIVKMNALTGEIDFHLLMKTEGSATISAIHYTPDYILVAGSVKGGGYAYGNTANFDDWDGYMAFVDPKLGYFIEDKPTIRFQSEGDIPDDYVRNVCVLEEMAFIVGRTDGKFDESASQGGAFVIAVDLETNEVKWKTQIDDSSMEAVTCAVSNTALFVGSSIQPEGGKPQDILLARLELDTGAVAWTEQVDSSAFQGDPRIDEVYHMYITQRGEVSMVANSINAADGLCDIFLMDVGAQDGFNDLRDSGLGVDDGGETGDASQPDGEGTNPENQMTTANDEDDNKTTTIIVATVVPLAIALFVAMYWWATRDKSDSGEEQATPKPPAKATVASSTEMFDAPTSVV